MPVSESVRGRLLRHDCLIAINHARANFAAWQDRLTAATVVLVALAVVRSCCANRPWNVAAVAALCVGVLVGIGAGRLAAERLRFHSSDGVLAVDALRAKTRRRYVVAWHAVGITVLAGVTLVASPSLLIVGAPAYLTGALVAHATASVAMSTAIGQAKPARTMRRWLHRPGAGIVAAIVLLVSLLPALRLGESAFLVILGVEAALLGLALTTVDHRVVRFMTSAGHSAKSIVVGYARAMLTFCGLVVPACWFAFGPVAAAIVTSTALASLLLLTLRVLAYRLHAKRFADFVVSTCAGLLMLVAYSMPLVLPFVAIVIIWQLQRRAARQTWLLP